jgi:Transposase IS116/IS110/IS902 family
LEEANIKLGSVASDVLGKSGRAMLTAMVEGQENPQQLADLALGQLRLKIPQLVEALRGRVRGAHRFRLKQQLERVDFIDAQIAQLEAEIERQNAPFDEAVSQLAEIPGFDRTTAWSVIAEIGIDMNQFPSADHLASWAGVCPGNNESGGKRLSGKTRKGSRWLRGQLLRPAQSGKTYSLFRQTANPTWPQSHPRTVFGRSLNPFQESYGLAMEASGLKSTRPTALTRNPDRGRSGVFRTVYSGVRGFESDP